MPKLRIIFGEILSSVENLVLPAPYFRSFQWYLSSTYRLAPRAAVRLARPLVRLWSVMKVNRK